VKNWFLIGHVRDYSPSSPRAAKDLSSYPKFLPTNTPRHIPRDHDKAREQITVYTPLHDPVLSRIHNARTTNPRCICSGPLCAVRIDHSSNTFSCTFFFLKSLRRRLWKVVYVGGELCMWFVRCGLGLETVSWEVEAWKVLENYVCGVEASVFEKR
jgi:hypothetical protein